MTPIVAYFSFAASLALAIVIVRLIRKRKLKEQYALLWLGLSAVMMVLSLFPGILDRFASALGVAYAPSLLYLLAILGILLIVLHMTLVISALAERTDRLAQLAAIDDEQLRAILAELKKNARETS